MIKGLENLVSEEALELVTPWGQDGLEGSHHGMPVLKWWLQRGCPLFFFFSEKFQLVRGLQVFGNLSK